MANFSNEIISGTENIKLNVRYYNDKINSDKTLIVTHGYGEHQEYYIDLANYFINNGFAVVTYDLRAHGLSEGRRGDVADFQFFVKDLEIIITESAKKNPQNRIYLFGHSMGGSIVLNYLLRHKNRFIEKAVITSPWLKLAFEPPVLKRFLAKTGKFLFPSLVIKGELDIDHLSRDNDFKIRFEKDPLTYDKISARYYHSIVDEGLFALENASHLDIPVLICHGDDDKITSFEASRKFSHDAGAEFKSFEGGYRHVIFSESDKEAIFTYIMKYLVSL
ncbi:MAG: lysophospholipase [Deltaproteobacteria bacterium]